MITGTLLRCAVATDMGLALNTTDDETCPYVVHRYAIERPQEMSGGNYATSYAEAIQYFLEKCKALSGQYLNKWSPNEQIVHCCEVRNNECMTRGERVDAMHSALSKLSRIIPNLPQGVFESASNVMTELQVISLDLYNEVNGH